MPRSLIVWPVWALATFIVWLSVYPAFAAKPDRISVAYCTDCVQFHFKNKDGKADGLIIDIWRLWSKKTGIAVDFKAATWEETLKMVADGRADAHAGLFYSKERARFLEYGTSLTKTDTQFFVHKNLTGIKTLKDLTTYKVGVLAGDFVEGFLKKKLPPENIVSFESYEAMMEALRKGSLYVFAADTPTGVFHLQKAGLGYVFEAPASKPLYTEKWFVATAKGNTELIKTIDDGMALITSEDRRKIERRWASISDPNALNVERTKKRLELTVSERQWLVDHPVIQVHNESNWPPFNFYKDGKPQGLSIDYMNLLASKIGIKVNYVTGPTWNEFLEMMKSGDLDVMLNIVKTPERQKYLLYTKPYAYNPNSILSRKENPYDNLEQLSGKTVALPKGFFYEEILKRDYPRIKLYLVKDVTEAMKAVTFGKADAALGELAVFTYIMGREMMTGLVISGEVKMGDGSYSQLNIATRKSLPVLASILTKAADVVTSEEIKALRQRWIDVATTTTNRRMKINLTSGERAWLAAHKTIRLGIDPLYPPFEFVDDNGTYSGMASDYVRLVSERLGITMKVVPNLSWDEVIDGLKKKSIDVLPAAVKSPERRSFLNFSSTRMTFPVVIVTRDDYPFVSGLNDLNGKTVAQTKGYAVTNYLEMNNPKITRNLVDDPLRALRSVSAGKVSATILNLAVATYLIKKHNLANLKIAASANINFPGLAFGVRKDWPEFMPILEKALATITSDEKNIIRSKWVSVDYNAGINIKYVLQAGGIVAIIVIVIAIWNSRLQREVKYRKQVEAALAQKTDILQAVLGAMTQGVVAFDKNLELITWNDNFLNIRGYPESLVKEGRQFSAFMKFDNDMNEFGLLDPELTVQQQIGRAKKFLPHEFERKRPDGRYIEVRGGPIPGGGFVSTFSDITERKRWEEELRKLSSAVENSPNSIIITDLEANILYVNPEFVKVSGYTEKEAIGRKTSLMRSWQTPPETYKEMWGTIKAGKVWRGELLNKKKNGELFWEYTSIAPVKGDDDETTHYVAVKVDVTELKEAKEAADAANKAKSEFLANMSHELRTPLNAIIGYSEMLIEDAEDDALENPIQDLVKIKDSGKHLHTMINEILDLAKIEAGKMEIFIEQFDVAKLVNEVHVVIEPMMAKKKNKLEIIYETEGMTMISDQTKVRQILFNLFSNATKFTENGDISLTVSSFKRKRKDWLEFTVSDTGIGMSQEQVDRLFEAFTQADASTTRNYGGTGLGLTITKHFSEMLGGEIRIESEEGKGTTFTLMLPANLK